MSLAFALAGALACGGDGPADTGGGGSSGIAGANGLTSGGGSAGTGGGAALSDGDRFLLDYASAVCAMYQPCCSAEGLGFDAAGCADWFSRVTAAYLPDQFVPEKGAACLEAVAAAQAEDADRCNTVGVFDQATFRDLCDQAFVAPARDGAPLGGECLLSGDCAATGDDGGRVTCYADTCILQREGAAGDGPCYAGGPVALQQIMYTCDAARDLYCNRSDNVCAPRVAPEERCELSNACNADGMCTGGICRALPGPGETCLNGVPGAGGFCRPGLACDRTTLVCGDALEVGAACGDAAQCASGVCVDDVCVRSDWQRNLNCTG